MKPACDSRPVETWAVPTIPAGHPTPARSSISASPGTSSRIFASSTSRISATVATTSLKNFCRSLSANARSPSRATASCWRARMRTSRLIRRRSVTSRHVPSTCTGAPSSTRTVADTSNQRSSRPAGDGKRYSRRHGSPVRRVSRIAVSTPGWSCGGSSSAINENEPSRLLSGRPCQPSRLVDHVIRLLGMSHDQTPSWPASSPAQKDSRRAREEAPSSLPSAAPALFSALCCSCAPGTAASMGHTSS